MTAQVTAAESTRICSHMNGEHGSSLSHYLEFYGKIPARLAEQSPAITNFSTPSMVVEYGPKDARQEWTHKFSPPMYAGEARKRLEAMHQEARKGLNLSEAVVNDPNVNLGFITMFSFLSFLALETLLALAPVQFLLYYLPWAPQVFGPAVRLLGFAQTPTNVARVTKTLILGALLGVHYFETETILVPLMRKYNCTNSEARRIWYFACIVGGFPVWKRFKSLGIAAEQELEKTKKSH